MTKDEALKLALGALERCVATCFDQYAHEQVMGRPEHFVNQTITALKETLAQPEQEPVAWMTINGYGEEDDIHYENPEGHLMEGWTYKPLYTHPPQPAAAQRPWVSLTDEELDYLCHLAYTGDEEFVLTVQAKLKDKNT